MNANQTFSIAIANRSMICLYWNIGKAILKKQEEEGWGTKVIDRMSKIFVRHGICATTRCTIFSSNQHCANLRIYLILRGEKPDVSGKANEV